MKKSLAMLLTLCLSVGMITGCGGITVVQLVQNDSKQTEEIQTGAEEMDSESNSSEVSVETESPSLGREAVKTGLSVSVSLEGADATAQEEGYSTANITLVAVTVDDRGMIRDCAIDGIKATVSFSEDGKLAELQEEIASKNELGENYGMKAASSIGREWNEQAQAIAQYAIGKTVEELKDGAVDEAGMAKDADLAASATMYIGNYISEIEAAVNQAKHLGAVSEDELFITQLTDSKDSVDAGDTKDGLAQVNTTVGALTLREGIITSCMIDGVQAKTNFDSSGVITSDLTAPIMTKNELGEGYGMKTASSIGKEWNEQAAAFGAYVTGKTAEEVTGMAVTEERKAADADLAASVTISIGDFIRLIEKVKQ